MDDVRLIAEKLAQATGILNEFGVDVWLTFVRETSMSPDPMLELIFGGDLTWQSAFLLTKTGESIAIVGTFDSANLLEMGVYSKVVGYDEGISMPLRTELERLDPQTIAINYSEGDVAADGLSYGMYRNLVRMLQGTAYGERLISAEKLNFALRGRKSKTEIARIQQAVRTTEMLFDEVEAYVRPGMTQRCLLYTSPSPRDPE